MDTNKQPTCDFCDTEAVDVLGGEVWFCERHADVAAEEMDARIEAEQEGLR